MVDAATFLTGPLAAQALADLGAEVVKVEPPDGDGMRRFGRQVGGVGVQWLAANRTRWLRTVDLATAAGRAELDELLAGADALVTNWRPGVAERLGLAPDGVADRHPHLVWCRISGFGQDGPRAQEPAFDSVIQAASGLMAAQGDGGRPELVRTFVADKVTATYAAQAVLAGLVQRGRTGRGTVVDVSMLDALAYWGWPDLGAARALPGDRGGDGRNRQLGAVRALPTADGWLVVAAVRGRQLRGAVEAAGHPEWVEVLRSQADGEAVTAAFFDLLAGVTPSRTTGEWVRLLGEADVPAAAVSTLDDHLADPQVRHNGTYATAVHPEVGEHRFARYPARWS